LKIGSGFQVASIEQRDAGALPRLVTRTCPSSATAPATPGNPGSVAMCLAGVVVNHLDAVARGVGDEYAPAVGIEGGVIEVAARGAWYGDVFRLFSAA